MKSLLITTLALPLALGAWAAPAAAGSSTAESTSQRMAETRSMESAPRDASMRRTRCVSFGPTAHYRCTTTWDD